jgi:hypothetical protein
MRKMFVRVVETSTSREQRAPTAFQMALGAGVALVLTAVASASGPVVVTTVVTFEEQLVAPRETPVATDGSKPLRDVNTCLFPITFSAQHIRTDKTFDNGDTKRHIEEHITRQANGHTASETDMMEVFIDHADPLNWKITGRFGQMFLDGKLIWLESGQLSMPGSGSIVDPHPGPKGALPDLCAILSQ